MALGRRAKRLLVSGRENWERNLKVKMFEGADAETMQEWIQKWLDTNPDIDILSSSQSQKEGWVMVTIIYRYR